MIVAERTLTLNQNGEAIAVPVRIFAPEIMAGGEWSCRYEIDWPDNKMKNAASGFDAMQAFVLALQMIGAAIYGSNYHKGGHLFWTKPGDGYGFPLASTLRDLFEGSDRTAF